MDNVDLHTESSTEMSQDEQKRLLKMQNFFFDKLFAGSLRDTPLKPIAVAIQEKMSEIKKGLEAARGNLSKAVILFESSVDSENKEKFKSILNKSETIFTTKVDEAEKVTDEEIKFLLEIARIKVVGEKYEEGSLMYRYILQIDITCDKAWVGWAICEQQLGHKETVNAIYDIALALLPDDYYVVIFAANFFISSGEVEKAKAILEASLSALAKNGKEDSIAYKELTASLSSAS